MALHMPDCDCVSHLFEEKCAFIWVLDDPVMSGSERNSNDLKDFGLITGNRHRFNNVTST